LTSSYNEILIGEKKFRVLYYLKEQNMVKKTAK